MAPCDPWSQLGCASSFRCQCKLSLPREFELTAKLLAKAGTPLNAGIPGASIPDGAISPSPLSFSLHGLEPPKPRMSVSLPCKTAHGSRRSTCGTLPRYGVSIIPMMNQNTGHHPGARSASQVIDGLRLHRHVARRVVKPPGSLAMCPGFPTGTVSGLPSFEGADFRSQKSEARPYPLTRSVHGSAPSQCRLTGKPSRAFHG